MILQPSSGNVGIGTTAPAYKLDVSGTINSTNISRIIASGSGTSARNFEITGLDLTNYIFNEIIVVWTLNTEGTDILMYASYDGTTFASANYEVTSYYSSPAIGITTHDSGVGKSWINVVRYSAGNTVSNSACTGILKINWTTNLGQRSPCFWTSSYTIAGQGCAHTTGTAQNTSSTGNPVKLHLSPVTGNFQAFKWRVIGHL